VDCVYLFYSIGIEYSSGDHGLTASSILLGWLKQHHDSAGEVARACEPACCAEQGCDMTVMPAGVHAVWVL
jgi:hypothetical protein